MAKKNRSGSRCFVKGMVIYAVLFLAIIAVGLAVFSDFIDAYEQSRPKNTMDAYVKELTLEDMCEKSQELIAQVDQNIQSAEECRDLIRMSVTENITYAKKSSVSTDTQQTYVLRSGSQVVGEVVIVANDPDRYGFTVWEVKEDNFDFSYLMGAPVSVTVPENFCVSINGQELDERYITESEIKYPALEEFYDEYELPSLVTYTADSFLGQLEMEVTDEIGQTVEITAETDWNTFLDNCTEEEKRKVEEFMGNFLQSYVNYTGSSNRAAASNYNDLRRYLVSDGDLARRLRTALDGLSYAQSHGDKIQSIDINGITRISDLYYMCDATYHVDTHGHAGIVQTTNNMKVMILVTEKDLRVEAMTQY